MATATFGWHKQDQDFNSTGNSSVILFDQPVSDVHFRIYQPSQNLCEICNKCEWGVKKEEETFI